MESTSLVEGWHMLKFLCECQKLFAECRVLCKYAFLNQIVQNWKKTFFDHVCLFDRDEKNEIVENTPKTNFRHLKPTVAEFKIFRAENIEVDICATDGTRPPA